MIPTRGNVDMDPILESLPAGFEVIVWDNSRREDLGIYGRYAGIQEATRQVIVTQDDDLIVTAWPEILEAYEPGVLVTNYTEPHDIPWVARGAIYDRDLPELAFREYERRGFTRDRDFTHWICDGVFAGLTPRRRNIDCGSVDLPYCDDSGRISSEPKEWYQEKRPLIAERCSPV